MRLVVKACIPVVPPADHWSRWLWSARVLAAVELVVAEVGGAVSGKAALQGDVLKAVIGLELIPGAGVVAGDQVHALVAVTSQAVAP